MLGRLPQGAAELAGKRLLIVTDSRVWSPGEGRNFRFTRLVSGLSHSGMRIDLVTSRTGLRPEDVEAMRAAGITNVIAGDKLQGSRQASGLRSRIRRFSPGFVVRAATAARRFARPGTRPKTASVRTLSELRSPVLASLVARYVHTHAPDFVMVEYVMHSYALEFLDHIPASARAITMIDTYDVAYQLCQANLAHEDPVPFLVSREEEKEALGSFDIIIAIQDEDRKAFQAMLPQGTVVTCLPACTAEPLAPPSDRHAKAVLFVGGDSMRNEDALAQFLEQVWPHIRSVHLDAALNVVGSVCHRFKEQPPPGVSFEGYVEDLRDAYARAAVVVSPVTYGAGLKIKVLEALAFGRPVVATRHSAIGYSPGEANGLLVADDWGHFATLLSGLLGDHHRMHALGQSAAGYVAREFGEARVLSDLVGAMRERLALRSI